MSRTSDRLSRLVAVVLGAFTVALGLWAFVHPQSFFDQLATFPPYNRHLLHDVGAFQVGLGAALLFAVLWPDALRAALAAYVVGGGIHTVSHVLDRDLGGRALDPIGLGVLVVAALVVLVRRWRAEGQDVET